MLQSNYFTTYFKKRENLLGLLCLAAGYCLLFSFIENPKDMTISLIAKEHMGLFFFFCLFYVAAMLGNFVYMFKTFGVKSKILKAVGIGFNVVFPFTLTTLLPPLEMNGEISVFATVVHWICGFGNIAANATVALVSCLVIAKALNSKKLKAVCAVGSVTAILDLLIFLYMAVVTKDLQKAKNGIFEIIPLAVAFAVTFAVNHTDLAIKRSERDKKELDIRTDDTSIFTAVSFAVLVLSAAMFTFYAFVRNPIHYTISMTGIDYPIGFGAVCVLLSISFVLNFILMFKKHSYKNVFTWIVAIVGSLAILSCVAVPTTMEENISKVHALGALIFFYFLMAAFVFYLAHMRKQDKNYTKPLLIMLGIFFATIVVLVVMFIILEQRYGRTGLTELVPIEVMYLLFLRENYFAPKNSAEVKEKNKKAVKA